MSEIWSTCTKLFFFRMQNFHQQETNLHVRFKRTSTFLDQKSSLKLMKLKPKFDYKSLTEFSFISLNE